MARNLHGPARVDALHIFRLCCMCSALIFAPLCPRIIAQLRGKTLQGHLVQCTVETRFSLAPACSFPQLEAQFYTPSMECNTLFRLNRETIAMHRTCTDVVCLCKIATDDAPPFSSSTYNAAVLRFKSDTHRINYISRAWLRHTRTLNINLLVNQTW